MTTKDDGQLVLEVYSAALGITGMGSEFRDEAVLATTNFPLGANVVAAMGRKLRLVENQVAKARAAITELEKYQS